MSIRDKSKCNLLRVFILVLSFHHAISFGHSSDRANITFEDVWKKVVLENPALKSASLSIDVSCGEKIQAGLIPNPSITLSEDNFAGGGIYRGTNTAESTVQLNQLIEIGGKRRARMNAADAKLQETLLGFQNEQAQLFHQTMKLFLTAAETQEKLALARQAISISQESINAIQKRMNAGRASELDLRAAQVALGDHVLAAKSMRQDWLNERFAIASLWGGRLEEVPTISLKKLKFKALPKLAVLYRQIENNLQLQIWQQKTNVGHAEALLADTGRIPNITAGVGARHLNQTNNTAYLAELSFALPVFDYNQGNRKKALAEYYQSMEALKSKQNELRNQLFSYYQIANQASLQMHKLQKTIIPQAKKALSLARDGYHQGRFSYIDLLNNQQKLLDEKAHYIASAYIYRQAWMAIQVLVGNLPNKDVT